jgi:Fe-S cluster biogenesis protein NfuA
MVTGLENSGDPEAAEMALELVRKWVKNNYESYVQSDHGIFEKYNVSQVNGFYMLGFSF